MDWDDARYFLAVVRAGSLSGAARELDVSHSTVRRRIAGLEDAVSNQLFIASSEGLLPTDAARACIPMAEALENAALSLERQLGGTSPEFRGSIRVTTIDTLAEAIAPTIAAFKKAHPRVELSIYVDNTFVDLTRGAADVAIRMGAPNDEALFGKKVGSFRWAPFAIKRLVTRARGRLQDIPWGLWVLENRAAATEAWFKQRFGDTPPLVRVSTGSTMVSLVQAGVIGAVLPVSLGERLRLVQVEDEIESFRSDIWCLTHSDLRQSARIRAFMQLVAETADFCGDAHDRIQGGSEVPNAASVGGTGRSSSDGQGPSSR